MATEWRYRDSSELVTEGLMTVAEVQQFLKLSRSSIFKMLRDGQLPRRLGGGVRPHDEQPATVVSRVSSNVGGPVAAAPSPSLLAAPLWSNKSDLAGDTAGTKSTDAFQNLMTR